MEQEYFLLMSDYAAWANERLLRVVEGIGGAEWTAPWAGGYRSLRGTLAHLLGSTWVWYERCQGRSPGTQPAEEQFTSPSALATRWREVESDLRGFVAGLDADGLAREVRYRTTRGEEHVQPIWQILAHVANHATQHRSEAALMLSTLGRPPGDLDLIIFLRERR